MTSSATAPHNAPDHRCRWTDGDRRCPAPGTIAGKVDGKRVWFCREHAKTRSRRDGNRVLDQQKRSDPARDSDWRDQLVAARMANPDATHAELMRQLGIVPKPQRRALRDDEALEVYREHRASLEARGMDRQTAHKQAIAAVAEAGWRGA